MNTQISSRYYSQNAMYRAIDVYNHIGEFNPLQRSLAYRYILTFEKSIPKEYKHLVQRDHILRHLQEQVEQHINQDRYVDYIQDLTDILLDNYPEQGEGVLRRLRQFQGADINMLTIYNDPQNVHNSDVNSSVKRIAKNLFKKYGMTFEELYNVLQHQRQLSHKDVEDMIRDKIKLYTNDNAICLTVLSRIFSDPTNFGIDITLMDMLITVMNWIDSHKEEKINPEKKKLLGMLSFIIESNDLSLLKENFTEYEPIPANPDILREIQEYFEKNYKLSSLAFFRDIQGDDLSTFVSIWNWIQVSYPEIKLNRDLYDLGYKRLGEEIIEMNNICATGMLSRLVNVLQGITEDPELILLISEEEQFKIVIKKRIDKVLKSCKNEKILDGMLDPSNNKLFKKFIKHKIDRKLDKWKEEYGEVIELYFKSIVNGYLKVDIYEK